MASYIRSVVQNRVTIAVGSNLDTILPPNPISHIMVVIRFQTLTVNVLPTMLNVLQSLASLDVLHRGTAVFSARGEDLWGYLALAGYRAPLVFRDTDAVNSSGFLVLCIPFGRSLYDPAECFPATRAGELILRLTRVAADVAITGVTYTVTTIELPDAKPERFIRVTTLQFTPSATGDNDFQLYPSTIYAGLLLFSTTVPTGTVFTTTVDRFQLLLNNLQYDVAQANWDDVWGEQFSRGGFVGVVPEHIHTSDVAAAYTQFQATGPMRVVAHPLRQYAFIDFDPTHDLRYAIDAREIARVTLRVNAGDTQPVRVLPCEVIILSP